MIANDVILGASMFDRQSTADSEACVELFTCKSVYKGDIRVDDMMDVEELMATCQPQKEARRSEQISRDQ